ncbi:AAA family ATPase [Algoriphagus kandeliae]|uniref:AAA family ATPase n=1 Tax=Algoriphagus kandeliae TaxID=2562278 RepID=A0A4Y9QQE0_9BACT|nr:AAA family ATPase [Algoriphagus kandeliae]TFV93183.1 AAA family ATPase [Algoriphagus kandeliae]
MSNLNFRRAARKQAKIKIGLQGSSGSGKSYSSLLLAFGLVGNWSKIAVIDSENNSADLYAHLGEYNVVPISAPYTPEKYIEAINLCVQHGMEAIVIDSISHEWEYLVDHHSNMPGNSFQNWGKITPRHNSFINGILQAPVHVIATIRSKQDYVLSEKNGKMVPEKVGLKGVTRDGMDYELTIVFDIDSRHQARASKDRTNLFVEKPEFQITPETGIAVRDWCNMIEPTEKSVPTEKQDFAGKIMNCKSLEELYALYKSSPEFQDTHKGAFLEQRNKIEFNSNFKSNGKLNIES